MEKAAAGTVKKSFVKGAIILGIAGIICKIIGAVYRIPLANIIGERGMAHYQVAYPIYTLLLVVSSAGLPIAISKMVAEKIAVGDHFGAHRIYRVSAWLLAIVGVLTSVAMMIFAVPIAKAVGLETAWLAILAIGPSLLIVSLISAFRGYFQGMQVMTPTAVSQIIEQVGKLAIGFPLALAFFAIGIAGPWGFLPEGVQNTAQNLANYGQAQFGAAGALLGVTGSELFALLLLFGIYLVARPRLKRRIMASVKLKKEKTFGIVGRIAKIAIPVTIGASIMPLVQLIDTAMVMNLVKDMPAIGSYSDQMFGVLTGFINPLINVPAVLTIALMMALVPAISSSMVEKDMLAIRNKASTGLKLTMIIGFPCAAGFYLLSRPILELLYGRLNNTLLPTGTAMDLATQLLQVLAIGIFFLSIVQTMTGVLQGIGRVVIPVINLLIGAAVKVVLTLVLVGDPAINIVGAAYSTIACYAVAAILNIIFVIKQTRLRFRVLDFIIKPALAAAGMGALVYFGQKLLEGPVGAKVSTVIAIVAGAIVYFMLILLFGALKPEDMAFMPGGAKLSRLMNKIGIWRK
ncbi:MAG: polysaccharide biosynthesis protein [Bacillota bacterium]|nr:polysaccharide biosynthesis protein [Bacillota bacterium]